MVDEKYTPLRLAELLTTAEAELATRSGTADVLAAFVAMALANVDGAESCGITHLKRGRFRSLSPTDDVVERVDRIQYDLTSGPCVDAVIADTVFLANDLATDERWPRFGPLAVEAGVSSMLSVRIFLEYEDDVIAALNFYASQAQAFDSDGRATAVAFAALGAAVLARADGQDEIYNLTMALESSRDIGVSIGILMALQKVGRDQAFELLRLASQRHNRKLVDIAADVIETGVLPDL